MKIIFDLDRLIYLPSLKEWRPVDVTIMTPEAIRQHSSSWKHSWANVTMPFQGSNTIRNNS